MRFPRPLVPAAGILALLALATRAMDRPGTGADPRPAMLAARVRALEARVELARTDSLYLVLEPAAGTLTLFRGGAALRAWPVESVHVGARRFASAPDGWQSEAYGSGRMDPPVKRNRRIIVSDQVEPPDPSGAETIIPPTPEEAVPAPRRFVVHYDGGLGLEVVSSGERSGPGVRLSARVLHRIRRLLPGARDPLRVRVEMVDSAAGALYRSFPEGSAFLLAGP